MLCFGVFYPTNAQDLRTLRSDLFALWAFYREPFFGRRDFGVLSSVLNSWYGDLSPFQIPVLGILDPPPFAFSGQRFFFPRSVPKQNFTAKETIISAWREKRGGPQNRSFCSAQLFLVNPEISLFLQVLWDGAVMSLKNGLNVCHFQC